MRRPVTGEQKKKRKQQALLHTYKSVGQREYIPFLVLLLLACLLVRMFSSSPAKGKRHGSYSTAPRRISCSCTESQPESLFTAPFRARRNAGKSLDFAGKI